MLATGQTTPTGVLSVFNHGEYFQSNTPNVIGALTLANAAMASRDLPSQFPRLAKSARHGDGCACVVAVLGI